MERLTKLDYMEEMKLIEDARAEYRKVCAFERRQLAPKGDDVWVLEQKQNFAAADWIKKRVQGAAEVVVESGKPLNMNVLHVEFDTPFNRNHNEFMKTWAEIWKAEKDKHQATVQEFLRKNAGLDKPGK